MDLFFVHFISSYPRGDSCTQLDLAMKKLERLMKEVGATNDSTLKEKLSNPEFQVRSLISMCYVVVNKQCDKVTGPTIVFVCLNMWSSK